MRVVKDEYERERREEKETRPRRTSYRALTTTTWQDCHCRRRRRRRWFEHRRYGNRTRQWVDSDMMSYVVERTNSAAISRVLSKA